LVINSRGHHFVDAQAKGRGGERITRNHPSKGESSKFISFLRDKTDAPLLPSLGCVDVKCNIWLDNVIRTEMYCFPCCVLFVHQERWGWRRRRGDGRKKRRGRKESDENDGHKIGNKNDKVGHKH
jgi:hypothetical protein